MFAAVIKNTILIFFVICIGYFLVDNHLNEMRLEQGELQSTSYKENSKELSKNKTQNEVGSFLKKVMGTPKTVSAPVDTPTNVENIDECERDVQMRIVIDPELKELYNYVFNDVKATDDLDAMFSGTEVKNVEKDFQIVCDKDQNEKHKIANMCSTPIEDHHKNITYDHISTQVVNDQSVYDFVDKQL
jgi:hypothetical protein